jgi:hypothetical protein
MTYNGRLVNIAAALASKEPHVSAYPEGHWYFRVRGEWFWQVCVELPNPDFITLYKKKGGYYVHLDASRSIEYSYRFEFNHRQEEEVMSNNEVNSDMNSDMNSDVHSDVHNEVNDDTSTFVNTPLFDDLRLFPTYTEALGIARLYQEREQSYTLVYLDPVKGKGRLTVNSLGIIDSNANITDIRNEVNSRDWFKE